MSIEYRKRTGNGMTWCAYCEKNGRYGLTWDSMTYDVKGLEKPMCSQCLKELREKCDRSVGSD